MSSRLYHHSFTSVRISSALSSQAPTAAARRWCTTKRVIGREVMESQVVRRERGHQHHGRLSVTRRRRDHRHAKGVGSEPSVFVHETFQLYLRSITPDLPSVIFYNNPNIRTRNAPAGKTRAAGHQQADEEIVRQMAEISKGRRQQNPYHISTSWRSREPECTTNKGGRQSISKRDNYGKGERAQ